jgi:hypothetical protein
MAEVKQYVIRTHSDQAHTYGLGEVISDGVALFHDGFYHLDWEQLQAKIRSLGKIVLR